MCNNAGYGLGSLRTQPKIAELIGEFICRWSLAEAVLIMPLMIAMDSSKQEVAAAMLSATNSTEGKIKFVKTAVGNMLNQQSRKMSIKKSLSLLDSICPERNSICHHVWAIDHRANNIVTIDFRQPEGASRIVVRSEENLRSICNRTVSAAKEICSASGSTWVTNDLERQLRL